jgi:ABC-2 type transport system permease protein
MTSVLAVWSLWRRDVVRFLRQPSRIVGALATPLVFWALLGSGLNRAFVPGGGAATGYLAFFFPGTIALVLLFTAIFSTISVIEDRQQGFLQGVLVAPVPRLAIVAGKLLGGTTLAVGQAMLCLLVAPLAGIHLGLATLPLLALVLVLMGLALTGLGFLLAWSLESTQGFHAIMNLLLVPMWLLSGAVFPVATAARWLQPIMLANPLTYGVGALQALMLGPGAGPGVAWSTSLAILAGFAAVTMVASAWLITGIRRPTSGVGRRATAARRPASPRSKAQRPKPNAHRPTPNA